MAYSLILNWNYIVIFSCGYYNIFFIQITTCRNILLIITSDSLQIAFQTYSKNNKFGKMKLNLLGFPKVLSKLQISGQCLSFKLQ